MQWALYSFFFKYVGIRHCLQISTKHPLVKLGFFKYNLKQFSLSIVFRLLFPSVAALFIGQCCVITYFACWRFSSYGTVAAPYEVEVAYNKSIRYTTNCFYEIKISQIKRLKIRIECLDCNSSTRNAWDNNKSHTRSGSLLFLKCVVTTHLRNMQIKKSRTFRSSCACILPRGRGKQR